MSKLHLYPYQQDAQNSVIKSFENKIHRQLLVLPTGAGKTILFIAITKHFNKKTLILAHRDELINQTYKKFKKFWPKADVSIYQGKNSSLNHQIIISSIQTCSKPNRLTQLKKEGFSVLIIDEAHHATSKSYQKVICELSFLNNQEQLLIGVTATPNRADQQSLNIIFQEIAYSITIDELIDDNYLSKVTARKILTNLKLTNIRFSMGDFEVGRLATAVNTSERNTLIVNKWKEHAATRKTIAFCVNVQHCKDLADAFNAQGISAVAVYGKMPDKLRKKILHRFRKGTIKVLTSCSLLTEGFDEPSISCVLMVRPTSSQSLYIQMIGRGLRKDTSPKATKTDCLILDFTDKTHNLNTAISLQQILPKVPVIVDGETNIKKQSVSILNEQTIRSDKDLDAEFNILGKPNYIWIKIDSNYSLTSDDGDEIVIFKVKKGFVAYAFITNNRVYTIENKPTTLKKCQIACATWVQRCYMNVNYADANSQWSIDNANKKPSWGQINILKKHNVYNPTMNKPEASNVIRKIFTIANWNYKKKLEELARIQEKSYYKIHMPKDVKTETFKGY